MAVHIHIHDRRRVVRDAPHYIVVPSFVLQHKTSGKVISPYSAIPMGTEPDDWERVEKGFTLANQSAGTVGIGRVPWKTRSEAEAFLKNMQQKGLAR
jgi:hypothetical protein